MVPPIAQLNTVDTIRHRFTAGQAPTLEETGVLLTTIDTLQAQASARLVHVAPDAFAAFAAGYSFILDALRRAGLSVERVSAEHTHGLVWVWYFCWDGGTNQGPYGSLDALIIAAVQQLRSGVLRTVT